MTARRFNVFGRSVLVVRDSAGWHAFDVGAEGKRRAAKDIIIPLDLEAGELVQYLGDLCHERATPEHPDVVPLD